MAPPSTHHIPGNSAGGVHCVENVASKNNLAHLLRQWSLQVSSTRQTYSYGAGGAPCVESEATKKM